MKIDQDRVRQLRARAQQEVDSGLVPSCQYALAIDGEVVVHETLGAPGDARYSIWSATKPVVASVVWQLIGEGLLDPDVRVASLWPEFGAHGKDVVTLDHLLLHTAGFPDATLDMAVIGDRDARVRQMEQWTLTFEPGTAFAYHGLSAHAVLAELITRVTGEDHRTALRRRVLDPLGLDRIQLGGEAGARGDLQPLQDTGEPATVEEILEMREVLGLVSVQEEVAQAIAAAAEQAGRPGIELHDLQAPHVLEAGVPGGGIVSDAASVALFYQALLHDRAGLWDPAVLDDVTHTVRNTFAGPPIGALAMRTRGLEVQGDDPTNRFRSGGGSVSPRTFGHAGAAGQVAWADPDTGLSFAYLTNGSDRNFVRWFRRSAEVSAAATACLA
jgi:CubicO group peptidase (beta-lactamase class C family)